MLLKRVLRDVSPDLLDVHEEPFSVAARQWLRAAPPDLPVVMYTAQNVDKRYPPPFAQYETAAHRRVAGLYPCSRQAASVAKGKGFAGLIDVIPLGYDDTLIRPGIQSLDDDEIVLGLFGRLVPEKGLLDAVEVLACLNALRPCRLIFAGTGPGERKARELAVTRRVSDRVEFLPWRSSEELAALYASTHVVLVPSRPTETWVEQFGRVVVEGQAAGAVVAGYASGSIPEVAGEPGVLVAVGDTEALAQRIATSLDDPLGFEWRRQAGIAAASSRTWAEVAVRQAEFYGRVIEHEYVDLALPRSPRARRVAARTEFGEPAATTAGLRPFALPVLRRGGIAAAVLAAVLDAGAELSARFGKSSRSAAHRSGIRIADRDIRRIALAPLRVRHWRALFGFFHTFDEPGKALARYALNGGKYPWRVGLRTPLGRVEVTLADRHDLLTVNEIFCRQDYGAQARRVVVDIGANVGFASLFFLTRSAEARVWAFEPDPKNVERLRRNVSTYLDRLSVTTAAVVSSDLKSVPFVPQGRYGRVARVDEAAVSVPAVSINMALRSVAEEVGAIDLVKIDTEGTEEELVDAIPPDIPISEVRYETGAGRVAVVSGRGAQSIPSKPRWTS